MKAKTKVIIKIKVKIKIKIKIKIKNKGDTDNGHTNIQRVKGIKERKITKKGGNIIKNVVYVLY